MGYLIVINHQLNLYQKVSFGWSIFMKFGSEAELNNKVFHHDKLKLIINYNPTGLL